MQSSRLAFAAVLVLFTLVGASLTSFATDHPAAGGIVSAEKEGADSALTDRVETLLRSDIGLVGSRLRVQSRWITLFCSSAVRPATIRPVEHIGRVLVGVATARGVGLRCIAALESCVCAGRLLVVRHLLF